MQASQAPQVDKFSTYCKAVAQTFMINEKDFVSFTNQFWGIQINQPFDLGDMYKQINALSKSRSSSQASTPASSQPSTPRLTPSVSGVNIIPDLLPQQITKATKKRVKAEDKLNTCTAIIKSGEKKNQVCGAACVDKLCATHSRSHKTNVDNVMFNASLDAKTAEKLRPVVTVNGALSATGAVTAIEMKSGEPKRKMLKKAPAELAKIDQLIVQRRNAINVVKNNFGMYAIDGTDLLFDPNTENVYGKQTPEGRVGDLKPSDIEHCKALKLKFFTADQLNDDDKMKIENANEIQLEDPSLDYEDEDEEEEDD
jgi:hypothetical protein